MRALPVVSTSRPVPSADSRANEKPRPDRTGLVFHTRETYHL
jgi:hypothetical protein